MRSKRLLAIITVAVLLTMTGSPFPGKAEDGNALGGGTDGNALGGGSDGNALGGGGDGSTLGGGTDGNALGGGSDGSSKGADTNAGAPAAPADLTPVNPTKLVAETDRLQLFVDEKKAQIRIADKRTGKEWRGVPQIDPKMPPNNRPFIEAPVLIRYTTGNDDTQTYPSKEKDMKTTMQQIEKGVRFTFDLPSINLGFAIQYELTDNGMEMTVPFDSIKESGKAKLTSLELLPFFGALNEQEEGAIFIPDGSGALIRTKQQHPKYFMPYSELVYGGDYAFKKDVNAVVASFYTKAMNPKQSVALPVFGIHAKEQGHLAILSTGEQDAKINATPPGIRNINLYRASAEFLYRKRDSIFVGNSGEIPLFQGNIVQGDRAVRYVLLSGEQANYVGMGTAYRDYLMNVKGIKPVVGQDVPLQLRLFGGVLRDEIIGSTFVEMTTFNQAKQIIDAYTAKGAGPLEITYDGWSDNGIFGNEPAHFPADNKLGGNSGLKDLADYAKAKGAALYLTTNYAESYHKSDQVKPSQDAIRGLDREVMKVYHANVATRLPRFSQYFYLLKPDRVYDRYIQPESAKLAELGIAGVHLKHTGDMLYSDQDPKNLTGRRQTAGTWVKALDLMKRSVGKTAVDYGFAYTLGHADRIDDAPLDSSHFTFTDEAVPFYQIALHGLVPYTAQPSNLRDDPRSQFLRALEYGAVPSFELTFEPSSKLQRTMMDRLFSSSYQTWLEPSIEEYKEVSSILAKVADEPIVNHEQIGKRQFRTTYGSGLQVIVNYDAKPAAVDGQTVAAYGYAVTEGGN